MIRIIICDDHPIFREGVKKILARATDMTVDAEASDGRELMDKLQEFPTDVVLLDLSLPGVNGLDVLKTLRGFHPGAPVVILSMHPEEQYAVRALRAGARGYVTKGSVPTELISAIRKVAGGGRYVGPALAEALARAVDSGEEKPAHEQLSDREYQVLVLITSGKGIQEIARELNLSPPTVGTYRTRILGKLGLTTTAELIRYGVTHNLS